MNELKNLKKHNDNIRQSYIEKINRHEIKVKAFHEKQNKMYLTGFACYCCGKELKMSYKDFERYNAQDKQYFNVIHHDGLEFGEFSGTIVSPSPPSEFVVFCLECKHESIILKK